MAFSNKTKFNKNTFKSKVKKKTLKNNFNVSDVVIHKVFGEGVILNITKENEEEERRLAEEQKVEQCVYILKSNKFKLSVNKQWKQCQCPCRASRPARSAWRRKNDSDWRLLAWCWLSQQRLEVFSSGLVVSIPGSEGEQGHQHEIQEGGQFHGRSF